MFKPIPIREGVKQMTEFYMASKESAPVLDKGGNFLKSTLELISIFKKTCVQFFEGVFSQSGRGLESLKEKVFSLLKLSLPSTAYGKNVVTALAVVIFSICMGYIFYSLRKKGVTTQLKKEISDEIGYQRNIEGLKTIRATYNDRTCQVLEKLLSYTKSTFLWRAPFTAPDGRQFFHGVVSDDHKLLYGILNRLKSCQETGDSSHFELPQDKIHERCQELILELSEIYTNDLREKKDNPLIDLEKFYQGELTLSKDRQMKKEAELKAF